MPERHSRPRSFGVLLTRLVTCAVLAVAAFPAGAFAAPERAVPTDPATADQPIVSDRDARIAPDAPLRALGAGASATGDVRIDALLSGYQFARPQSGPPTITITFSFYENDVWHGDYLGSETGCAEVSEAVKTNVRKVLSWYSTLMNIDFVEVTESVTQVGQLRYLVSNGPSYAWGYYPTSESMWSIASDVHLSTNYDLAGTNTNYFRNPAGSHGYQTLVHETGHALGLKHPFDGAPNLPAVEDNDSHTVMTYTWNGSEAATPMTYDVMALQSMYGARTSHATDDVYALTSLGPLQYSRDGVVLQAGGASLKQTLWDSGGVNTLDASGLPANSGGYRLDLRPGGWLTANSAFGTTYFSAGTAIGEGVAIRDFVSSTSNDTVYANSFANVFSGYSPDVSTGSDTLWETSPSDIIDLAAFDSSQVATAQVGSDLLITLGARGSITVKNWATGSRPYLSFSAIAPNQAPVARASASATQGTTPLTVDFSGTASTDPDGDIASWVWAFGDGTSASGVTARKAYSVPGVYQVTLTVTDDDGATAVDTLTVTVSPTARVARVSEVSMAQTRQLRGSVAQVTVTVTDASGTPVAGATVRGRFGGLVSGGVSGVTDASGHVTFTSRRTLKAGGVSFAVTGLTPPTGVIYEPALNLTTTGSLQILP